VQVLDEAEHAVNRHAVLEVFADDRDLLDDAVDHRGAVAGPDQELLDSRPQESALHLR
jgi:hypothetical protein